MRADESSSCTPLWGTFPSISGKWERGGRGATGGVWRWCLRNVSGTSSGTVLETPNLTDLRPLFPRLKKLCASRRSPFVPLRLLRPAFPIPAEDLLSHPHFLVALCRGRRCSWRGLFVSRFLHGFIFVRAWLHSSRLTCPLARHLHLACAPSTSSSRPPRRCRHASRSTPHPAPSKTAEWPSSPGDSGRDKGARREKREDARDGPGRRWTKKGGMPPGQEKEREKAELQGEQNRKHPAEHMRRRNQEER